MIQVSLFPETYISKLDCKNNKVNYKKYINFLLKVIPVKLISWIFYKNIAGIWNITNITEETILYIKYFMFKLVHDL